MGLLYPKSHKYSSLSLSTASAILTKTRGSSFSVAEFVNFYFEEEFAEILRALENLSHFSVFAASNLARI